MARLVALLALAALVCAALPADAAASDGVPMTLGGLTLGEPVDAFRDKLLEQTAVSEQDEPYLTTVYIDPEAFPGYFSGSVAYGNCARPGVIVRLKFKFSNTSRDFFEALLKRYTARFGKPDKWRGDAFSNVLAWKWSLGEDADGSLVSLVLTHSRDEANKLGNSVKMTLRPAWEAEEACWRTKQPETFGERGKLPVPPAEVLDTFVPR